MSIVTTIDLGSNSFRVLIYNYEKHIVLKEYNQIVGTADNLINTGLISKEAIQRVIGAINKSSSELDYNPRNSICVTTAAMRMAKNSDEVFEKVFTSTGVKLNIIDGEEEARLTLLAIKHALKRENLQSENFVLLDIGGGSVELTIHSKHQHVVKSFDFGIVTLTQKFQNNSKLISELNKQTKKILSYLSELKIELLNFEFIATAGTPTTIAAVKHGQNFLDYNKEIVNGTVINLSDINTCLSLLKNKSDFELNKIFGPNSKDFIKVGILIYKSFFEILNKTESTVFDDGLKEGVAINFALEKDQLSQ